jgi:AcrR family transcriptional regulator
MASSPQKSTLRRNGSARGNGGPRDMRAILAATLELLGEVGYTALAIEGVAARAGVAKSTIYRWWPSKAALVIEAIAPVIDAANPLAPAASESLRDDLLAAVQRVMDAFTVRLEGQVLAGLVADFSRDPEMAEKYRQRVLRPRRSAVARVLREWVARGRVRPEVDPELVQDLYVGPIYYRALVTGAPVDRELAGEIVEAILRYIQVDDGTSR